MSRLGTRHGHGSEVRTGHAENKRATTGSISGQPVAKVRSVSSVGSQIVHRYTEMAGCLPPARFEPALPVINARLAELLFGIHDEGPPCHDRFAKRAAREEQTAQGRSAASDVHF